MLFYNINAFITFIYEVVKIHKISCRVTTDRHFAENNKVSIFIFSKFYCVNNFIGVTFKIANMIILLGKNNFHFAKLDE